MMNKVYVYTILVGTLTSNENYSSPILSIHTYHMSSNKTMVDYGEAQFSNKRVDPNIGSLAASNEEHLSWEETTVMIPIGDIISIYYTLDVKKSAIAAIHSRPVPVTPGNGCCGCCTEDPPPPPAPVPKHAEAKCAQRVITMYIQYSKYSNLNTVSHAHILPEQARAEFYKEKFQPNELLTFYLVRNAEYDTNNFSQKKMQAEHLCRIVMQLKAINVASKCYPSPQELEKMLQQSHFSVFGDIKEDRLYSM